MKRLLFLGMLLCGLLLLLTGSVIYAQDDDDDSEEEANVEDREYVGSRECAGCHSDLSRTHQESPHALALIDARDDDFFIADFDAGEDVRTFTLDDEARPFEQDDIAYAVGRGRYVQRYLVEVDRDEYAVLPAEWNALTEEWQPYGDVENWPDAPEYQFVDNCAGCHTTGLNANRGRWEDEGVQCEACHGPGSEHVEEAEDAGNSPSDRELRQLRGAIVLSPDPMICGQCHIRGTEPEDGHPYPIEYLPTENLLDEDIFIPVPPDDEAHWWATGHAKMSYMQFNEWAKSAHTTALTTLKDSEFAEDACLQCHSGDYRFTQEQILLVEEGDREGNPPDPVTLENAELGIACTNCHNPHADPEETTFYLEQERYALCVDCHNDTEITEGIHHPVQEMHEGETIVEQVEGIASAHFTHEDGPDCVTCHMQRVPVQYASRSTHLFEPVLPGENIDELEDVCSQCHGEQIAAVGLQAFIQDVQTSTEGRVTAARDAAGDSSPEWVMAALDFVEGDGSQGVHNYNYSDALLDAVELELGLDTTEEDPSETVETAEDAAEEVAESDEDAAKADSDEVTDDSPSGLTTQAIVVMVASLLLLLFAGWTFFFRQGNSA